MQYLITDFQKYDELFSPAVHKTMLSKYSAVMVTMIINTIGINQFIQKTTT